jgi:hypothetical protein
MDLLLDRVDTGRTIKSLLIAKDATHECVAIIAEHSIGGMRLMRILEVSQVRQAGNHPNIQWSRVRLQSGAQLVVPDGSALETD